MRASSVVFDERAWWQRPSRLVALAAASLAIFAAALWWAATTTSPVEPGARRAPRALPVPTPSAHASDMAPAGVAQAATVLASTAVAPPPTAPSIMVAPGVHITPLSVPAGTVPVPAGPSPHDSEPEN